MATATCPPASSRPDPRFPLAAVAALLLAAGAHAGTAVQPEISLAIDEIVHADFHATGVQLSLGLGGAESASLSLGELRLQGRRIGAARLDCGRFALADNRLVCARGRLSGERLAEALRVDLDLDLRRMRGRVELRGADEARLKLQFRDRRHVRLRVDALPWSQLSPWLELPAGWSVEGMLTGVLDWRPTRTDFRGELREAAFSDADGRHAGEKITLGFSGHRHRSATAEEGQAEARWLQGAVYWQPFMLEAGPTARLRWNRPEGAAAAFDLEVTGAGFESLHARARGPLAEGHAAQLDIRIEGAELATLGPRFLAPWLDAAAPESWRFAGKASARLDFEAGTLHMLRATLSRVELANSAQGWRLGPVSGRADWQAEAAARSTLEIDRAAWRKLEFGAFGLELSSLGRRFELDRVRVPVLDGALVIEKAHLTLGEDGPVASAAAFVEPVSMRTLSAALDWPPMTGRLSASVPTLRYAARELGMDGTLVVGVFGGYVQASGLRAIDPFGPFPRLLGELDVRALDLGMLTDAFSFGRVSGRIDASVKRLELSHWKPVRFDARISSSPGDYSKRISQRAVQNIGALGGGVAAGLQRSFLGLFETFGYRRIGLACRLQAGVCEMDGLRDAGKDGGFVIVEGGGLPALNVIGYNRRVDWEELVARLNAAIDSGAAPVVR